jgi:hypothetical protein
MASFAVKEWQPLSVLKMLIVQTMHSLSFGSKIKNAQCSQWTGVVGFLFLFFSHTGDVVSVMMSHCSPDHYISGIFDITAHLEDVVVFRCLHHQGMIPGHLLA